MRTRVFDDAAGVSRAAADRVAERAAERPELVLALPTGRTAIGFYDELARLHRAGRVDLSRARVFNLDELLLPVGHPASFAAFMRRHAGERIGLDPDRCDIPRPADDAEAECRRYDRALAAAGRLDLAILGVGTDGHVAYNLPGPPREATHVVELPAELAARVRGSAVPAVPAVRARPRTRDGDGAERLPLRAITMGFGPLLAARSILLMAFGAEKAPAIRALVEGPEDNEWPCSLLRPHASLEVLIDHAAASRCPSLPTVVSPEAR